MNFVIPAGIAYAVSKNTGTGAPRDDRPSRRIRITKVGDEVDGAQDFHVQFVHDPVPRLTANERRRMLKYDVDVVNGSQFRTQAVSAAVVGVFPLLVLLYLVFVLPSLGCGGVFVVPPFVLLAVFGMNGVVLLVCGRSWYAESAEHVLKKNSSLNRISSARSAHSRSYSRFC